MTEINVGIICTDKRAAILAAFLSKAEPTLRAYVLQGKKWYLWEAAAGKWRRAGDNEPLPPNLDLVFQHANDPPEVHLPAGVRYKLWVKFTEPGDPPVGPGEIPIMPGFPRDSCPLTQNDLIELLEYARGERKKLPSIARRSTTGSDFLFALAALCQAHLVSSFSVPNQARGVERQALSGMGWTDRRAASREGQEIYAESARRGAQLRSGQRWLELLHVDIWDLRNYLHQEWTSLRQGQTSLPIEISGLVDALANPSSRVETAVSARAYLKLAEFL